MGKLDINIEQSVIKALTRAGIILKEEAVNEAPEITGDLKASIYLSNVKYRGSKYTITVGCDPMELGEINYAPFVHQGTGLYGPRKKRIFPKTKKALAIPGWGVFKSIKGQQPNQFFERAVSARKVEIVMILSDMF